MISIGNLVSVIDDELEGRVKRLTKTEVVIETEDGFELSFLKSQVVVIGTALNTHAVNPKLSDIKDKSSIKRKTPKVRTTKKQQPALEIDLHIHQLVKSTQGMTKHDMLSLQLDTARYRLEYAIKNRIQRIVFIHGVGEGVLKLELQYLFGRYSNIEYYDADYQKYGLGATEVYVYQNASRF